MLVRAATTLHIYLPTPVGPRNARVAIGLEGSDMPALDL